MPQTKTFPSKKLATLRGRFYELPDGTKLPSVTNILGVISKPALIKWSADTERALVLEAAANLYLDIHGTPEMSRVAFITTLQARLGKERAGQKLMNAASEIGSQIHAMIEWDLRCKMLEQPGASPHVSDKAMWGYMAWQDWAKSVKLRPIHIEQAVWSRTYGYAGTLDLLAEVNGVETVLDWKSGKAVYMESHLQNAAYRHAIREMGHAEPKQGLIVRVPKNETDPEFEVIEANDEKESLDAFLHFLEGWKWQQKVDKWLAKQEAAAETAA